jgi:FlaA1/EpsC-like NDP-sugar epimerase
MELLRKNTPRWVIFLIDIFICVFSVFIAYLLRFNFAIPHHELMPMLYYVLPIILVVRAISFLISRLYAGLVRFASTKDAERIFLVTLLGSIVFVGIDGITYYTFNNIFIIPFSIIILDFLVTVFTLTFSRLLVKSLYFEYVNPNRKRSDIIIIGIDELAHTVKRAFDNDVEIKYRAVAFIDPSGKKNRNKFEGIDIYSYDKLAFLIEKHNITSVVFATTFTSSEIKNNITDICFNLNVNILTIPEASKWINGELSANQLKKIRIEDLLEREPIQLDKENIKSQILGKVVMVTGAAGSIGREMVIQLTKFKPKSIVLFDQAETPLNDLSLELEDLGFNDFKLIIGDLTNAGRLNYIIDRYKPSVIYHAGAYKHVPMMEKNPAEAVITNVLGTKTLAYLAHVHKVERFVMISTDKAVNPTNVMGASKRVAEIYTQSLGTISETRFITTRFGNVLGSNGSVIPRFRAQIENGGPITVTHPEITRYFMTIPEACQLVLEAAAMGKGGEIFIFDMGKSVKIVDLAKKMIRLSGLVEDKDIKITFTGLRPGEKIYEELLNDKENTVPTYHPQIMIAKVRSYDYNEVNNKIEKLLESVNTYDNYNVVAQMKEIVPEFISANSVYEKLDKKD